MSDSEPRKMGVKSDGRPYDIQQASTKALHAWLLGPDRMFLAERKL